jgi:hypothetical protein
MATIHFNYIENEHCSYEIINGLRIHFECVEPNTAHMYFTNAEGNYIDVPYGLFKVYRHIKDTDKVIHKMADPLLEQMHNKKRTGYLYTYYLLNQNEEYEMCWKYTFMGQKGIDDGDYFRTVMRLVPHSATVDLHTIAPGATVCDLRPEAKPCLKMVSYRLVDYKKHS